MDTEMTADGARCTCPHRRRYEQEWGDKSNDDALSPSAIPLPLGRGAVDAVLLARGAGDVDVLVAGDPPLLGGAGGVPVGEELAVGGTCAGAGGAAVAAAAVAVHAGGVEGAGGDVGVDGAAGESLCEGGERAVGGGVEEGAGVGAVGAEAVGGVGGDAARGQRAFLVSLAGRDPAPLDPLGRPAACGEHQGGHAERGPGLRPVSALVRGVHGGLLGHRHLSLLPLMWAVG